MELDAEGSGLSRSQRHWCCEASDLEAGAQSLNRADGNGRRGVVGNRVRQRLAAADRHRSEVQAAAPERDSAGTVRTSDEAVASGEQPQAARNHEGCRQPTKQPITVQSDLCAVSANHGGGFWATGAPKCHLRQDQCRSWWPRAIDCERAGWPRHLASVRRPKSPFPRCTAVRRKKVPKSLLINGSRSVHAEIRVTGVTLAEVLSSGR